MINKLLISPEVQAKINLAQDFQTQGFFIEAAMQFDAVIDQNPDLENSLTDLRFTAAWNAFKLSQDTAYWRHYERLQRIVVMGVLQDTWYIGESTLACEALSNLDVLTFTKRHAQNVIKSIDATKLNRFSHAQRTNNKKRIKIGFIGSDFLFGQATSYLLTGAVEAIDRNKFEVYAYDHGDRLDDDYWKNRAHGAYDNIISIKDLSDDEASQKIFDDGIDILLSIKNPASARLGILAQRPAPIQIHYLYFPGTSGMPFFDYFIGDDIVTPPALDFGYAEKILRIEGCYQPNDDKRALAIDTVREQWGLPQDAIVMANMSQSYKITPQMFDVWCALLKADSRRILWLLGDEKIQHNLRQEAVSRHIAPERIMFSLAMDSAGHLARLRCADLVLDTFPYGGHTLTSDALWAGTPVVTLAGTTYASRVAASLLSSVGMFELVAWSKDEYLLKADALARDVKKRIQYRQYLDAGRATFDLFSPSSYAERFERLLQKLMLEHKT